MNKTKVGIALLMGISVTACQDRTVDDYRQQLEDEEYAKIDAHKGTYAGSLTQEGVVSPFTFDFGAIRKTVAGGSDAAAQQQVFARGTMTIYTPSGLRQLSFDNGSYYDGTKQATADVPITAQSASGMVTVMASFSDDGAMTGEITADSLQQGKATFNLLLNGPLPSAGALSGTAPGSGPGFYSYYEGVATFADNAVLLPVDPPVAGKDGAPAKSTVTRTVRMSIANSLSRVFQTDFYEYFLPVKNVDIKIFLGEQDAVTTISSQLDLRGATPTITGRGTTPLYDVSLSCTGLSGGAWDCRYSASSISSLGPTSFEVILKPKGN